MEKFGIVLSREYCQPEWCAITVTSNQDKLLVWNSMGHCPKPWKGSALSNAMEDLRAQPPGLTWILSAWALARCRVFLLVEGLAAVEVVGLHTPSVRGRKRKLSVTVSTLHNEYHFKHAMWDALKCWIQQDIKSGVVLNLPSLLLGMLDLDTLFTCTSSWKVSVSKY